MQHRRARLNDLLLGFLAEEIRRLRDPRLALVTVTGVEASPDYKFAKVFWSSAPAAGEQSSSGDGAKTSVKTTEGSIGFLSTEAVNEIQAALEGAEGLLRKRISAELDLRHTPKLQFKYDASAETGSRIEELLKKAGF